MESTSAPSRRALNVTITTRTMFLIAAFAAAFWAVAFVREAILSLFFALFAAFVLDPVIALVQRKLKIGRGPAATLVVLGIVAATIVILALLLSPFVESMSNFVDALPSIVQDIRNSSLGSWIDQHSGAPEQVQANAKDIAVAIGEAAGGVLGVALSAFSLILGAVTLIFLTLFLIIDLPRLFAAVDSVLAPGGSERFQRIMPAIITAVSRTMLGNIAISIICGTIYGLSAWALGTPFPLALALISAFLDLIPMVGASVAGAILVLTTLTQGVTQAVIMLAIVLIYQQVENYLLQPTILGRAADVSGFFVIASVMVFGALLGVIGAIIAVPIVASIQIVVKEMTAKRREAMTELRDAQPAAPSA